MENQNVCVSLVLAHKIASNLNCIYLYKKQLPDRQP